MPTKTNVPARSGTRSGWWLSMVIAFAMGLQSVSGLLFPSLYRDGAWIRAAWYGNDWVTLLVGLPLMVGALWGVHLGSRRWALIWYSMLGYCIYNYAFYLFGARINWQFPLYVVLLALPILALILALSGIRESNVVRAFAGATMLRPIAAYMLFTGVGLLAAWIAQWLGLMVGAMEPALGEEAFQLIAALDLTLVVPWFLLGAFLLLRRAGWGYIIACIIILKGATYTLVLTVTSVVAVNRGVADTAGQIPIWLVWTLVGTLAAVTLIRSCKEEDRHHPEGLSPPSWVNELW